MHYTTPGEDSSYDVIVIGGALSGAASATLLLRQSPGLRVLIIEKSDRKPLRNIRERSAFGV